MPLGDKRQRIVDLEYDIQAQIHITRAAISDGRNPQRVMMEVNRLRERIARDQKAIDDMLYRLEHWQDILDTATARIEELRKELVLCRHEHKIEQLMRLMHQLNDLEQEETDDEADEV